MLLDGHRDASPCSVFRPPASLVVKGFVGRERFPDVPLNREGVCDRDLIAIAVDLFCWKRRSGIHVCWKKSSDIHVALRDFKLVDREHNRSIDPKLMLLDSASKSSRMIREFIKPVCRDRVIQIAGSDRKKLCCAKSGVKLCGRCFQFADVKAVEFKIDPLLHRSNQLCPARGRNDRAISASTRYVYFLGKGQRAKRKQTDRQTWHMTRCEFC